VSDRALQALISSLLISAAALFAIGVATERNDVRAERSPTTRAAAPAVLLLADADQGHEGVATSAPPPTRASRERSNRRADRSGAESPAERGRERGGQGATETPAQRARQGGTERPSESAAQVAREQHGERIFGIDPDSTALVLIAVAVSVILAAAIWLVAGIYVPVAIAAFAIGATVFDVREVAHQISEHRTNLIVIASVVAALHVAAAVSAVLLVRNRRRSIATAQPDLSRA
jgi:hypothetical protein